MIQIPLTAEEKSLREKYDRLKAIRKALSVAKHPAHNTKEAAKIGDRVSKKSNVEVAAVAAEEVKRKIISGAITLAKTNEKNTFKRLKIPEKRPSLEKTPSTSQNPKSAPTTNEPMFSPPYSTQEPRHPRPQQQPGQAATRGPTLYIRGIDLAKEPLEQAFSPFGTIVRCFVEDRKKSAFMTFSSTEQAEAAMAQVTEVDQRAITVSFARRQGDGFHGRQNKESERTGGFRKRPGFGAEKRDGGPIPLRRWAPSTSSDSSAPSTPITPGAAVRAHFQKFVPASAPPPSESPVAADQAKEPARQVVTYDDSCPFD